MHLFVYVEKHLANKDRQIYQRFMGLPFSVHTRCLYMH